MKFLFWGLLFFVALLRILTFKTPVTDGQKVRISTKVLQEPIRQQNYQRLVLENLIVYLDPFPEVYYGDEVVVEGVVSQNKLVSAKLLSVKENQGILPNFRKRLINFYQDSLPEPHASLIAGITLGSKGSLGKDFWDKLKNTGVVHVVVASGTNITLVAGFLVGITTFLLKRRLAIVFVLVGIWLYAVLSGFDAPIVRAAIMGSLVFTAQEVGRLSQSFRVLVITGLLMLIIKPAWIRDLGFILSFVATGSLIVFQERINKKIQILPAVIREGMSTSLAAQIGVAPILFVTFGSFNILSPIINALVLWSVPLIMVISGVAGLVGLLFPFLGRMILYLTYPLTSWFVFVVDFFG
ncbi:hypothetical protein A3E46_01490 [Candidatus Woesebacteria bacterium RIFCSPHIGHO2_12_FULL_46_16]|uniref:ComEC/Rec2-related protein domain-containing protein n=1 Tax=Candidatus Woesebacteria bacterium RIFCSPHIGHO2_12_FULL_46_16 TaxID=1802513 RepID=A0A1F8AWJ5_9BACT|nr:MAG: hypothetical protein A3E46_01490 [Candidatus Woesebacteria bacterium RIFCSPHIGHO2_12_FULL_46_16]